MKGKEKDSTLILDELLQNMKTSFKFLFEILVKLDPKIEEKSKSFKVQLDLAYKTSLNNNQEDKIKNLIYENEMLIKKYEDEKAFFLERIDKLEKENKVITENMLRSARVLTTNEVIEII